MCGSKCVYVTYVYPTPEKVWHTERSPAIVFALAIYFRPFVFYSRPPRVA